MPRKIVILTVAGFAMMATGFAAKKPKPSPAATLAAPKIPQMTDDQKALHALNRLTFGPRPGDLEQVKQMGVDKWIEQQLQPDTIAENPVLLAKLEPLDTLQMGTAAMLQKYPSPQMLKSMIDGKLPLPQDKQTRAAVQIAIARYEQKRGADVTPRASTDQPAGTPTPPAAAARITREMLDPLPLDADQK